MMDGAEWGGDAAAIQDELHKARDEVRSKLHLASADTLGALEMVEREIERVSSSAIDQASLQGAVARIRHVSAALERARIRRL